MNEIIKNILKYLAEVVLATIVWCGLDYFTGEPLNIVGNLIDRLLYESVIDYLSFTIFNYNFPVFNLADIAITCGIFLLLYYYIKEELFTKKVEKTK